MKRLFVLSVAAPSAAFAHAGDHHATGVLHLLTEPDHLAMIVAVVAVLGYLVYEWARR